MKLLELFESANSSRLALQKPYIIAEAGVNHEGLMETAKKLIDAAAEGGAQAIKFQTYRAETIAVRNSPAYWDTTMEKSTSQYELFKKYDSFWKNEFEQLKKYCDHAHIEFLSTPFDLESAKFLNDLVDVFKISSSDITNKPFVDYICHFGKPIILSTGASYLYEIQEAVNWVEAFGNPLSLLHCVLSYPTDQYSANLGMIIGLKRHFPDKIIGYSDHTLPGNMKILEIAAFLGAAIIEKHFTIDKTIPGNDHYHAMDMEDLKIFRKNMDHIYRIIGPGNVTAIGKESNARIYARRSLVARRTIPKNKIIEYCDLTWKRPATGISPRLIDDVVGKKTTKIIDQDSIFKWDYLSG